MGDGLPFNDVIATARSMHEATAAAAASPEGRQAAASRPDTMLRPGPVCTEREKRTMRREREGARRERKERMKVKGRMRVGRRSHTRA